MAELLIARGADLAAEEAHGYTPLSRATFKERAEMMALLKRHGAECQPADVMGKHAHDICAAAGN